MPTTTWETLTTRQQIYLKAVFDLGQDAEQAKAKSIRYDLIVDTYLIKDEIFCHPAKRVETQF